MRPYISPYLLEPPVPVEECLPACAHCAATAWAITGTPASYHLERARRGTPCGSGDPSPRARGYCRLVGRTCTLFEALQAVYRWGGPSPMDAVHGATLPRTAS